MYNPAPRPTAKNTNEVLMKYRAVVNTVELTNTPEQEVDFPEVKTDGCHD